VDIFLLEVVAKLEISEEYSEIVCVNVAMSKLVDVPEDLQVAEVLVAH